MKHHGEAQRSDEQDNGTLRERREIKSGRSIPVGLARLLRRDSSIALKVKTCIYRSFSSGTESNVLERAIKAGSSCRQIISGDAKRFREDWGGNKHFKGNTGLRKIISSRSIK